MTPLSVSCGGLGFSAISAGNIPFGDSSTALASTSQLNWNKTVNTLYAANISSNAIISGIITTDEINSGKISISTSANFSCPVVIAEAVTGSHAVTKGYVDGLPSGMIIVAGDGLTLVNSTLNVNSTQPQITSLGALTTLSVGGKSFFIGIVRVVNRRDCCQNRILGFQIEILDTSSKVVYSSNRISAIAHTYEVFPPNKDVFGTISPTGALVNSLMIQTNNAVPYARHGRSRS